jgi:predicted RNA-binding Zn-ribbon protein involved in translation (DUF1610 family)
MRYRVMYPSGEFECPGCGEPVVAGDMAWDEEGAGAYCSAYCAGWRPGRTRPVRHCRHCGGRFEPGESRQGFCCWQCATAFLEETAAGSDLDAAG